MIDPGRIPTIPGDMDALAGHAAVISRTGTDLAGTGEQVDATWQGLAAVYQAPEASELFAATGPVKAVSASVGEDITAAGTALSVYAVEVRDIQARLESLRTQAAAFVASVDGDTGEPADAGTIERDDGLVAAVAAQVAAFIEAQRRCANTINGLYGAPLRQNAGRFLGATMFGATAGGSVTADASARVVGASPAQAQAPASRGDGQLPPELWRLLGDGVSLAGRTLDGAADTAVESVGDVGGALVGLAGDVTGDPLLDAVGAALPVVADEVGDQAADSVLEEAVKVRNDTYELAEIADGKSVPVEVYLSRDRHPESLTHILEAQEGWTWTGAEARQGPPRDPVLTIDRDEARTTARRDQALYGVPYGREIGEPGFDRDEYPPAVSREGGNGASVKYVPESDNRGSGATLRNQTSNLNEGDQYIIVETG